MHAVRYLDKYVKIDGALVDCRARAVFRVVCFSAVGVKTHSQSAAHIAVSRFFSTFGGKAKRKKFLFGKPFADEAVADLTAYQVEMFEYRRSRIQVIIIHFCYRKHEIYDLVVTLIQARQHRVILKNPAFHILLNLKTDCPFAADRENTRSSGLLLQTVAKATSLCSCRKSNALCMISGDLVVK